MQTISHQTVVANIFVFTYTLYLLRNFIFSEDVTFGIPHPVHLHGHQFHLLKMQFSYYNPETGHILRNNDDIVCADDTCAEYEWRNQSWGGNNIPGLNLINPPIRDTVSIPTGGYIVVRFMANNPGEYVLQSA